MNKFLIVSVAALFTLMVFVEKSQQQTTAPPPTVYEGCTCVGKPERPDSRESDESGERRGGRRGPGRRHHGRPQMPDVSGIEVFNQTETHTIGRFFCACPNY